MVQLEAVEVTTVHLSLAEVAPLSRDPRWEALFSRRAPTASGVASATASTAEDLLSDQQVLSLLALLPMSSLTLLLPALLVVSEQVLD